MATEPTTTATKRVVLILGATGLIGRATIKHLLERSGDRVVVRAGSRNPDAAPEELKSTRGLELVRAAVGDDKEQLKEAFRGVDTLFVIPPPLESAGPPVNAAIDVAIETGVRHLVVLSSTGPDGGKIAPDHTFYPIVEKVRDSFPSGTLVNHPFFMENNLGLAPGIKAGWKITQPLKPESEVAWVAVEDAGKFNAAVLSDPEAHKGKVYSLFNDKKSNSDLVSFLGDVTGRRVRYEQQTYEEFAHNLTSLGIPEFAVEMWCKAFRVIDEGRLTSGVSGDFLRVTGEAPLTLQQWCQQNAKAFQ